MWRGNSRQSAIWYDEYPVFRTGVSNKVSPKEILSKPTIPSKASGYTFDKKLTIKEKGIKCI